MSNIFSTSFGINFAKLTRVWLALISLTLKSTAYFFEPPCISAECVEAVNTCCSEYVLDQLEADRKFLLFAHHQEMIDAVEDAVRDKVSSFISVNSVKVNWI